MGFFSPALQLAGCDVCSDARYDFLLSLIGWLGASDAVAGGKDDVPANSAIINPAVQSRIGKGGGVKKPPQRMTRAEAREAAKELGYDKEVRDPGFNSHGQPVFQKGNRLITPDVDAHRGGSWKLYDIKGNRLGTYNANLTIRLGD